MVKSQGWNMNCLSVRGHHHLHCMLHPAFLFLFGLSSSLVVTAPHLPHLALSSSFIHISPIHLMSTLPCFTIPFHFPVPFLIFHCRSLYTSVKASVHLFHYWLTQLSVPHCQVLAYVVPPTCI